MSKVEVLTYDMSPRFSETVLSELDRDYSRKTVNFASHTDELPFGLVVGKGSDGKYRPAAPASGEGANAVAAISPLGILITPLSKNETEGMILTGYCIVNANGLQWDDSITDKDAAIDALEARGIIVREA